MSILLARASFSSDFVQIDSIEKSVYIHICNAILLLSKSMIRKKNWNFSGEFFSVALASILLLSSFGVLTHDVFVNAAIDSEQTTDRGNAVSNTQPSSNVKHVNIQADENIKSIHVKSPSHIPPLIFEQFMQSKMCNSKCIHPKSP